MCHAQHVLAYVSVMVEAYAGEPIETEMILYRV